MLGKSFKSLNIASWIEGYQFQTGTHKGFLLKLIYFHPTGKI